MPEVEIKELPAVIRVGDLECGEAFVHEDIPYIKLYEEVTDAEGDAVNAIALTDGRAHFINLQYGVRPISKIIVEV